MKNDFWTTFLSSNSWQYKLLRTIAQGVIGAVIANLDLLLGYFTIPPELKPFITAVVMAILSPIMALLGEKREAAKAVEAPSPEEWAIMNVPEPDNSYDTHCFTEDEIKEYRAANPIDGGDEDV